MSENTAPTRNTGYGLLSGILSRVHDAMERLRVLQEEPNPYGITDEDEDDSGESKS